MTFEFAKYTEIGSVSVWYSVLRKIIYTVVFGFLIFTGCKSNTTKKPHQFIITDKYMIKTIENADSLSMFSTKNGTYIIGTDTFFVFKYKTKKFIK